MNDPVAQRERARLRDVVMRERLDQAVVKAVENLRAAARRASQLRRSIAIPSKLPTPAGTAALAIAAAAFGPHLFPRELGAVPPPEGVTAMIEPRQLVALVTALARILNAEHATLVEEIAVDKESDRR